MKTRISVMLLSLFLFAGCKPKEQETRRFEPGFKEYFDYHPGSYWVMEDQYTGITDSFYVDSRVYDPGEVPATNDGRKWESISIRITQAGRPENWWGLYLYLGSAVFRTKTAEYEQMLNRGIFPLPFTDTSYTYSSAYRFSYYGDRQVSGNIYDSLYRTSARDIDHQYYDDTVYFNRQQGFVEFAQHNGAENHRWLLKRSNIIR